MYKEQIFHDKEEFMTMYRKKFLSELGREFEDSTSRERYDVLVKLLLDHIRQIHSSFLSVSFLRIILSTWE